ncbi:MAG: hypothetical protein H0U73_03750 [Tatlockia sp.]|nr:hypothetical protein [Tatlockia sp.]
MFNIFKPLSNFYYSNITLQKRVHATFWVIFGSSPGNYNYGESLGLYDYLCLLIPLLISYFFLFILGPLEWLCGKRAAENIIRIIVIPFFIFDLIVRSLTSIILILCLFPLISLFHFTVGSFIDKFIISLINKEQRSKVDGLINFSFDSKMPLILKHIDFNTPGITDYFIEQLNLQPSITKLELIMWIDEVTMGRLIKELIFIEELKGPKYRVNASELTVFAQSNLKVIRVDSRFIESNDLQEFLKKNKSINRLFGSVLPVLELKDLNQLMEKEGIQHPCRVFHKDSTSLFDMNSIARDIHHSFPIIKACFEFFKIMQPKKNSDSFLPFELTQFIALEMLQLCPQGIFNRNKKGFIRVIQSNGFFSEKEEMENKSATRQKNDYSDLSIKII